MAQPKDFVGTRKSLDGVDSGDDIVVDYVRPCDGSRGGMQGPFRISLSPVREEVDVEAHLLKTSQKVG